MKRFSIITLFLVLLTACQEELYPSFTKVEVGLPASLSLNINVPEGDAVVVTKGIQAYESQINTLALIMFEQSSGKKVVVDLTDKIVETSGAEGTNGGYRTYSLAGPVETLSGNYNIYAIANFSGQNHYSPFLPLTIEELSANETETAFLNRIISTSSVVYSVSGNTKLPMSGVNEGVTIYPEDQIAESDEFQNNLSIKLRRIVSHIEFTFASGEGVTFDPEFYRVYNLPKNAYLIDQSIKGKGNNVLDNGGTFGHMSREVGVPSNNTVEFFMLENIQVAKNNCNTYADRDKWNGFLEDGTKSFNNAPLNGTYLTVTGRYEDGEYTGNVSYTVHLGNFGSGATAATTGNQNNNFEVKRNTYHTYKITVAGVNSIITEAGVEEPDGGKVPGAEGELVATNQGSQFVLDSHFETMLVSFELSELCANPNMMLNTPINSTPNALVQYNLNDRLSLQGVDYKWIKFMAPAQSGNTMSFKPYPGNHAYNENGTGELCDIFTLAQEIKNAYNNGNKISQAPAGAHYYTDGNKIYTVAFVEEYFYPNVQDWRTFVNTANRIMILNPEKNVSADLNNTVFPRYLFQISQRSIKTTYSTDSHLEINAAIPFGIETWNETGDNNGRSAFGASNALKVDQQSATNPRSKYYDDGWGNSWKLLGGTGNEGAADELMDWPQLHSSVGYLNSITSNDKASHRYEHISWNTAYNACLTRNRDEDGDGKISPDEIKWYLPAVNQYRTIWLNQDVLREDTQLFDPNTSLTLSNLNTFNFFTSSYTGVEDTDQSVYWAAEGASSGAVNDGYAATSNAVRCVRNLAKSSNSAVYNDLFSEVVVVDEDNQTITILQAGGMRQQEMTGEYRQQHNERDLENQLYKCFKFAKADLGDNVPLDEPKTIPANTWLYLNTQNCNVTGRRSGSLFSYRFHITVTLSINRNMIPGATYYYNGALIEDDTITLPEIDLGSSSSNRNTTVYVLAVLPNGNSYNVPIAINLTWSNANLTNATGFNESYATSQQTVTEITGSGLKRYNSQQLQNINPTDFCAGIYYEEYDRSDLGKWRVPNQREFMLAYQYGFFGTVTYSNPYASSTLFTDNGASLDRPDPFGTLGRGVTLTYLDWATNNSAKIRCVRDWDPSYGGTSGGGGSDNEEEEM